MGLSDVTWGWVMLDVCFKFKEGWGGWVRSDLDLLVSWVSFGEKRDSVPLFKKAEVMV